MPNFLNPLVATVRDNAGNPVSGAGVLFTAPASNPTGNFSGSTTAYDVTNSSGNAVSPIFTAGGTPGTYNVTASTSGVTAIANFTLTNSPPSALTISPTSVNFGSVNQGQQSSAVSVTAKNTGGTSIAFSRNAQLTGAQANQFKIDSSNCQNTLAPGASCTVTVQFQPNATGAATANLVFSDNAPNNPQSIPLAGNGINARISLHPDNLNFQKIAAGSSAQQTVTVTSSGTTPLEITGITATAPFSAGGNCPMSPAVLNPGATCSITVTFAPAAPGNWQSSIYIADNASGSPQKIGVQGQAVQSGHR